MKKILVPHDFTNDAHQALDTAIELAKKFDSEITIMHVGQFAGVMLPDGPVLSSPLQQTEHHIKLQEQLEEVKIEKSKEGINLSLELRFGLPAEEILRFVRTEGIDLIVIASHGKSRLSHLILGGTAYTVVRRAECQVLVVKSIEIIKESMKDEESIIQAKQEAQKLLDGE